MFLSIQQYWTVNGHIYVELPCGLSDEMCVTIQCSERCSFIVAINTVGTPYNTNVGVQKIPDRAIWKPMVAKRNNTNPWSWLRPQILVTQDSGQPHMSKQPASRDWPEQIAPLVHSSQTAWQLFNLGQSIEIRIPHLLGHIGQLHTKCISHIWLSFSVL